jgi:hypothetical protein
MHDKAPMKIGEWQMANGEWWIFLLLVVRQWLMLAP